MLISGPLDTWREEVGRRFLNLDFKPASHDPFRLSLDLLFRGPSVGIGRTRHTAGETFRDKELAQKDGQSVSLLICRSGTLHVRQNHADIDLDCTDATLIRNYDPGHVGVSKSCDYIGVFFPEADLRALGLDPERLIGINWRRSNEAMRLLKSYIACLKKSPPPISVDVCDAASRHIIELVGLAARDALNGEPAEDGSAIRDARLQIALAYIAENFQDPDLTISAVAAQQRVSPRYLQHLFETAGIQYVSNINELRLQKAYGELTGPLNSNQTIADIAFAAGFSDISHFNRLFRRRFDATPSAIRSRQRG